MTRTIALTLLTAGTTAFGFGPGGTTVPFGAPVGHATWPAVYVPASPYAVTSAVTSYAVASPNIAAGPAYRYLPTASYASFGYLPGAAYVPTAAVSACTPGLQAEASKAEGELHGPANGPLFLPESRPEIGEHLDELAEILDRIAPEEEDEAVPTELAERVERLEATVENLADGVDGQLEALGEALREIGEKVEALGPR